MNLYRLDLVSLSLFTFVVRTGSISKGAELAHLAVGAASKRISDLEAAVDAELFDRHSRGVTLTAAGEALHRHAQRILHVLPGTAVQLLAKALGLRKLELTDDWVDRASCCWARATWRPFRARRAACSTTSRTSGGRRSADPVETSLNKGKPSPVFSIHESSVPLCGIPRAGGSS